VLAMFGTTRETLVGRSFEMLYPTHDEFERTGERIVASLDTDGLYADAGAMLFATALTNDSMADNFADPRRMPVWLALGREVMAVAHARGVTPVGFGEFDPAAFLPGGREDRQQAIVGWLAEYTSQTAKTHSGIWRDLAVRKRKTEVDPQIGIVSALGREAGIATPAIDTLVQLVHDIEDGRRPLSYQTLKVLIDTCRSASMDKSRS